MAYGSYERVGPPKTVHAASNTGFAYGTSAVIKPLSNVCTISLLSLTKVFA